MASTSIPSEIRGGGSPCGAGPSQCGLRSVGFRLFLVTQFLGAFNDNAFRLVVSLLAVNHIADENARAATLALAGVLFSLPFIVFSSHAGCLADRFSKRRVMIASKVAEIGVMALGGVALLAGSVPGLLIVVFLMGAQSAMFSPAKFGSMPEMLAPEELPRGNGYVQLFTFSAIIGGVAVGGLLSDVFSGRIYLTSLFFIGIAVVGTLTCLGVPRVPAAGSDRRIGLNPFPEMAGAIRVMRRDSSLAKCVAAISYFWFLSALFQVTLLLHAKEHMGLDDRSTGWLLASIGLGVGLGSVLAGKASHGRIAFGLTPIGATLIGGMTIALFLAGRSVPVTIAVLLLLGIGGGFYCIPPVSHIQKESPVDGKGQIMAFRNVLDFTAMLLAYPAFWLLNIGLGLSPRMIFVLAGTSALLAAVIIARRLADHLIFTLGKILMHPFYRVRVEGVENVPRNGGALLVTNHVSYADAVLLQASVPRFIRYLMATSFFNNPRLHRIASTMDAIPVSTKDSPKQVLRSLRAAAEGVRQGEIVGIFAEGTLTKTGTVLAFNRGLEVIMKRQEAPIIPVYIHGLLGSPYSHRNGKLAARLWTSRFPVSATIMFGSPLPARTPAHEVRQAVTELAAECAIRDPDVRSLATRFFRQARRHPFRFCMAGEDGKRLSYGSAAIRALCLARLLRRQCGDQTNIGILLPNTPAAAIANIAVSSLAKVSVNLNYTAGPETMTGAVAKCDMQTIMTSRRFIRKIGCAEDPKFVYVEDIAARGTRRHMVLSALRLALYRGSCRNRADDSALLQKAGGKSGNAGPTERPATILFSSGSTGDPKGVMLSNANLNANIDAVSMALQLRPKDRVLGNLPFFHSFGLLGGLWFPLATGRSVVYTANPLDFKSVGKACEQYGATVMISPPTFLAGILRRCSAEQLASLRLVITGAEKLSPKLAGAFESKFGVLPLEAYGATELSPAASMNLPGSAGGNGRQPATRQGTVGLPLSGIATRVVDPDTYERRKPGEDGLLLVRGPNVMLGYLNDPQLTAEAFRDGWYITGDIAAVDEAGFITIRDRLSRFSKIGGEMVPHERIEAEIQAILGTAEKQCVVTGVPDQSKGERLVALCRRGIDLTALQERLRDSSLPNLWIPRGDAFVMVDDLPTLGSGKLDLKGLKALALQAMPAV